MAPVTATQVCPSTGAEQKEAQQIIRNSALILLSRFGAGVVPFILFQRSCQGIPTLTQSYSNAIGLQCHHASCINKVEGTFGKRPPLLDSLYLVFSRTQRLSMFTTEWGLLLKTGLLHTLSGRARGRPALPSRQGLTCQPPTLHIVCEASCAPPPVRLGASWLRV